MKSILIFLTILISLNFVLASDCPSGVYPCNPNVQFNNPKITEGFTINYINQSINGSYWGVGTNQDVQSGTKTGNVNLELGGHFYFTTGGGLVYLHDGTNIITASDGTRTFELLPWDKGMKISSSIDDYVTTLNTNTEAGKFQDGTCTVRLATGSKAIETSDCDIDINDGTINGDGSGLSNVPTYNSTYDTKADYQFTNNNFNGSGNFTTTGNLFSSNINLEKNPVGGEWFGLRIDDTAGIPASYGTLRFGILKYIDGSFSLPGIWFNTDSPSWTNYAFLEAGSGTNAFNGANALYFRISNSNKVILDSTGKLNVLNNLNVTGNISTDSLIKLKAISLPACSSVTNGSIGRNSTKLYYCDGVSWNGLY